MTDVQRTLVLVKPDGVARGLVGAVVQRLEAKGLTLAAVKVMNVPTDLARTHYGEHEGKPFYQGLIEYITACPIVGAVLEGTGAVETVRKTMGATNPAKAEPGTIRGDLGLETGRNLIHGSDSVESAAREIGLFFQESDLHGYQRDVDGWIFENPA